MRLPFLGRLQPYNPHGNSWRGKQWFLTFSGTNAGNLPAAWGTMGAFESLKELNLNNNSLSGTLPAQWGDTSNGAVLVSLQSLDVSTNSLSGALPATWGSGFAVSH